MFEYKVQLWQALTGAGALVAYIVGLHWRVVMLDAKVLIQSKDIESLELKVHDAEKRQNKSETAVEVRLAKIETLIGSEFGEIKSLLRGVIK